MKTSDQTTEIRDKVIYTELPDGTNYFMGVKEIMMKNKFGVEIPMKHNIWGDFTDLRPHQGIFTQSEAEFFVKEIIYMEGVFIRTWAETARIRGAKNN